MQIAVDDLERIVREGEIGVAVIADLDLLLVRVGACVGEGQRASIVHDPRVQLDRHPAVSDTATVGLDSAVTAVAVVERPSTPVTPGPPYRAAPPALELAGRAH